MGDWGINCSCKVHMLGNSRAQIDEEGRLHTVPYCSKDRWQGLPEAPTPEQLGIFWVRNYVHKDLCSLCGNSGVVDTRGRAVSAVGVDAGRRQFCVCPNGQTMKEQGWDLDADPVWWRPT
jgi:hypothetical protein